MATTTTNKLYMRFKNENTQDRTWSFSYLSQYLSQSQVTQIANAFIQNNIAFKSGYRPQSVVAVWWESVTKNYLIE